MKNRFLTIRSFFAVAVFLAPDDPGSGGGGGVEAPTAPEASDDMISTQELEAQLGAAALEGAQAISPTPTPPTPTPPAQPKKEEPAKPDPQQAKPKKTKDENMAELRRQAEEREAARVAAEKERDDIKASRTSLETEKASLAKEIEALKSERQAIIDEREEIRKQLLAIDAMQAPEIAELGKKFNAEISEVFEQVPALNSAKYNDLLRGYMSLPHGKEDFAEKHAEFREVLKEQFPDDWQEVNRAILRGVKHVREERELVKKIQGDSIGYQHKRNVSGWEEKAQHFDKLAPSFFHADESKRAADPYDPMLFIADYIKNSPEEGKKLSEYMKQVTDFVRNTRLGPKPVTDADFAGMEPQQIADRVVQMQEQHQKNGDLLWRAAARGFVLERLFRPMVQLIQKNREALEAVKKNDPPNPELAPNKGGSDATEEAIPSPTQVAAEAARLAQQAG